MLDWLGNHPKLLLLLYLLVPLVIGWLIGAPKIPSWDNCTIGWAIPC